MEITLICVLGVVAALCAFSLLLGLGTVITRSLRLPNDPPFDALFSCPAPPLINKPDRARAQQQAQLQQQQQHSYHQAQALCMHALQCHDAVHTLGSYTQASNTEQAALKALKPIEQRLSKTLQQIEALLKAGNLGTHQATINTWHNKHQDDCQAYQDILAGLPAPNNKRLYLLIGALFVACSLLLLAHFLAPR